MTRFLPVSDVAGFDGVILDCRFSLQDPDAGRAAYAVGHLPGAVHLDLNQDMSGPVGRHGGRHPLPSPRTFAERLAVLGVTRDSDVLLYDDSRYAFAARAWWMLRALDYREPKLLLGGYAAWLAAGGEPDATVRDPLAVLAPERLPQVWPGACTREDLAELQAQGATLVDAREAARYRGEVEPIDPVAGHIPGAVNRPWQDFIADDGSPLPVSEQRARWGDLADGGRLVVYCGSGVSACVNLLSLAEIGYDDALLYGGSWSDWCSYL